MFSISKRVEGQRVETVSQKDRGGGDRNKVRGGVLGGESRKIEGASYSEVVRGLHRQDTEGQKEKRNIEEEECPFLFQSSGEEAEWLKGAFTGCLKGEFSWKEHGEEIRAECAGLLILKDLGNNLVLIQSAKEGVTEAVIRDLDEWSGFWFEWWQPWEYTHTNTNRVVWTRWVGVPLHAWNERFFGLGCAMFGRMLNLHPITATKSKLDEAFVRISMGLNTIDRLLRCRIDGVSFAIRIEEIKCMDWLDDIIQAEGENYSEASSEYSAPEEWEDSDSVEAKMDSTTESDCDGESPADGGGDTSGVDTLGNEREDRLALGSVMTAREENVLRECLVCKIRLN